MPETFDPATAKHDNAPVLVGRAREQALLHDRLAAALAGQGGLVLVGGEAGIGKTTLTEWLGREAAARGAALLTGRCYDLSITPPYGPWIELFEHAGRAGPPDSPLLALADALDTGSTSQAALFRRVRDALLGAARYRPLLLFLDDLHWADQASLDLLRFAARESSGAPLLIVGTYRADEVGRDHPLAALLPALVREAAPARLALHRLDDSAVRALLARRYGLPPDDEARLVAYLHGRAEGNPFYLGELLRSLEEQGVLRRDAEAWRCGALIGAHLPALLLQVIAGRLGRLSERAQRALVVAAVIGQEVPLALWGAVAEMPDEPLLDVVERAVEAHLLAALEDGTGVRFVHALTREALYDGLLPPRRRRWHERIAEHLLREPDPHPEPVAFHLRAARDERAAEWLVRAGERAEEAFAWQTAAARYEAALEAMGATGTVLRAETLVRLARLRRLADPYPTVAQLEEAVRLADAAGDAPLAALARFRLGINREYAGDIGGGLPEQEAALALLDALPAATGERIARLDSQGSTALSRRCIHAHALGQAGHYTAALREADRVLRDPEVGGLQRGVRGLSSAHFAVAWVRLGLGQPEEARAAFARGAAIFRGAEDYLALALTLVQELTWVIWPYQADRPAAWREVVTAQEWALAQIYDQRAARAVAASRLPLLLRVGAWDEARRLALATLAAPRFYVLTGLALAALGILAREEDHATVCWALVRAELPAGPATAPGTARYHHTLLLQRLAAALATDAGDLATARDWLAAHDRWLDWAGNALGRSEGHLGWSAWHEAGGDATLAWHHAERALACADDPRQPLALLAAHRQLGSLATGAGRYGDAAAHLRAALDLADACESPYERARTLLALGELQRARGTPEEVPGLLAEVRAIGTPLGAARTLARAEALHARLAGHDTGAKGITPAYPAGLSAREVEVLRLIAQGLTNGQTADRLFLSRRTVDHHLRSIYAKLAVTTRAAAARFATEHGLV